MESYGGHCNAKSCSQSSSCSSSELSGNGSEIERLHQLFINCDSDHDGLLNCHDVRRMCDLLGLSELADTITVALGVDCAGATLSFNDFLHHRSQLLVPTNKEKHCLKNDHNVDSSLPPPPLPQSSSHPLRSSYSYSLSTSASPSSVSDDEDDDGDEEEAEVTKVTHHHHHQVTDSQKCFYSLNTNVSAVAPVLPVSTPPPPSLTLSPPGTSSNQPQGLLRLLRDYHPVLYHKYFASTAALHCAASSSPPPGLPSLVNHGVNTVDSGISTTSHHEESPLIDESGGNVYAIVQNLFHIINVLHQEAQRRLHNELQLQWRPWAATLRQACRSREKEAQRIHKENKRLQGELDRLCSRYEDRITELHSVIAELRRKQEIASSSSAAAAISSGGVGGTTSTINGNGTCSNANQTQLLPIEEDDENELIGESATNKSNNDYSFSSNLSTDENDEDEDEEEDERIKIKSRNANLNKMFSSTNPFLSSSATTTMANSDKDNASSASLLAQMETKINLLRQQLQNSEEEKEFLRQQLLMNSKTVNNATSSLTNNVTLSPCLSNKSFTDNMSNNTNRPNLLLSHLSSSTAAITTAVNMDEPTYANDCAFRLATSSSIQHYHHHLQQQQQQHQHHHHVPPSATITNTNLNTNSPTTTTTTTTTIPLTTSVPHPSGTVTSHDLPQANYPAKVLHKIAQSSSKWFDICTAAALHCEWMDSQRERLQSDCDLWQNSLEECKTNAAQLHCRLNQMECEWEIHKREHEITDQLVDVADAIIMLTLETQQSQTGGGAMNTPTTPQHHHPHHLHPHPHHHHHNSIENHARHILSRLERRSTTSAGAFLSGAGGGGADSTIGSSLTSPADTGSSLGSSEYSCYYATTSMFPPPPTPLQPPPPPPHSSSALDCFSLVSTTTTQSQQQCTSNNSNVQILRQWWHQLRAERSLLLSQISSSQSQMTRTDNSTTSSLSSKALPRRPSSITPCDQQQQQQQTHLEAVVLYQELCQVKEDRALLRSQLYSCERELTKVRLTLESHELQGHVNQSLASMQNTASTPTTSNTYNNNSNSPNNTCSLSPTHRRNGTAAGPPSTGSNNESVKNLIECIERLQRHNMQLQQERDESVGEMKRANAALVEAFEKAKKKYICHIKRLETKLHQVQPPTTSIR